MQNNKLLQHSLFSTLEYFTELLNAVDGNISEFNRPYAENLKVYFLDPAIFKSLTQTYSLIVQAAKNLQIKSCYLLLRDYNETVLLQSYIGAITKTQHNQLATSHEHHHEAISIEQWLIGKDKSHTPKIERIIAKATKLLKCDSEKILLATEESTIRIIANDYVHNNGLSFITDNLINTQKIWALDEAIKKLDQLELDIKHSLVRHLSLCFLINDNYMRSEDYLNCLDSGIEPEEEMQSWLAPFTEEFFNDILIPEYPEITTILMKNTNLIFSETNIHH